MHEGRQSDGESRYRERSKVSSKRGDQIGKLTEVSGSTNGVAAHSNDIDIFRWALTVYLGGSDEFLGLLGFYIFSQRSE